jgi:hypothetical protein
MNTTGITQYRVPFGSKEWHNFRTIGINEKEAAELGCKPYEGGIGSSEIAKVCGLLEDYPPCIQQIYHWKVGDEQSTSQANKNTVMGQFMEPAIGIIWKIFDGDQYAWPARFFEYMHGDAKTRQMLTVRKSRNLSGYYVNNKYPYLFSSYDFFAEKGTPGLIKDENGRLKIFKYGFPIECKRIKRAYARTFESGYPEEHSVQVHQEMICSNSDYGEIAALYDDNDFEIIPLIRNEQMCDYIIKWGLEFWNKVLKSREALKLMNKYYELAKLEEAEYQQAIINSNEPEMGKGLASYDYKKAKYKEGIIKIVEGDIDTYFSALSYNLCGKIVGLIEAQQQGYKNQFMQIFETGGYSEINFGSAGKITYEPDKNGKRAMRVPVTSSAPMNPRAEEEFNKLNFELQ